MFSTASSTAASSSSSSSNSKPAKIPKLKHSPTVSTPAPLPIEPPGLHTNYDILGQFGKTSKNKIPTSHKVIKTLKKISEVMSDEHLPDVIKAIEMASLGSYSELAFLKGVYKSKRQLPVSGNKTIRRFE
jgi:hypothetical protein